MYNFAHDSIIKIKVSENLFYLLTNLFINYL